MTDDNPFYTIGEEMVCSSVQHRNDASNIWGLGWHGERRATGPVLSFLRAAHGGGEMTVSISEAEFEQLRHHPEAFGAIAVRNGG